MEKALLLVEPSEFSAAGRLEKVLAVFGVACRQTTVPEFLASINEGAIPSPPAGERVRVRGRPDDESVSITTTPSPSSQPSPPMGEKEPADNSKFRLLGSSAAFLKLAGVLATNTEASSGWQKNVHSAFVFAGNDPASFEKLARQITGDPGAALAKVNQGAEWHVSGQLPEFCKSMSGVRVAATTDTAAALAFDEAKAGAAKIISTKSGAAFMRLEFQSVPVFLSTAEVVDVAAPLPARVFDIRTHFLSAVPLVLYVKWAFAEICWQPPETAACLVIDDPLLQPRYGFLNFQRLLDLMEHVNFTTSIAFIPWNCNRSARKIIRLFQKNPQRFSLSVHGCDHTGGEFGSRHPGRLAWKSRQAMQRMARHQSKTGLPHDPVMVFPQGVFSEAAMAVLKRADFMGVVNSEVISTDPQPRPIKISDYWDVAVMNYSDFPIFTRRYPWAGVENFAFDILLGKPCLVVVHHNDCHDDCRHVVEFMERLNQLNARLRWTSLAEVVRRSFRQREISPGTVEVEMYGREVRIENPSTAKKVFRFRKRESAPETIQEIRAAAQPVKWSSAENQVAFEVELNPGESQTVSVTFTAPAADGFAGEKLRYRVKAMVRRYLCELRDNYVTRKSFSQ